MLVWSYRHLFICQFNAMRSLVRLHSWSCRFTTILHTVEAVSSAKFSSLSLLHCSYAFHLPASYWRKQCSAAVRHLSGCTSKILPLEAPTRETLLRKLDTALKDDSKEEALEAFRNYKRLHGLPEPRLLNSIIISLSYASSRRWLQRAYDIVLTVHRKNCNLLNCSSLTRLALALARNEMPSHASTVLRIILESGKFPLIDMLSMVFLHMVKSQVGSYLAADILSETCELLLDQISDRRQLQKLAPIKSNITLFNIVLDSCVRFKCIIKAQRIMELMAMVGVTADVSTVVIISRVFVLVGQRDELINLKGCIDSVASLPLIQHYQKFYDCLLSMHFNYHDIDAAANLMIDLYRRPKSGHSVNNGLQKQGMVLIGSGNLKTGYKITFDPQKLDKGFILDAESQSGLVLVSDGRLVPSEKALAKLTVGCLKARKVAVLSSFLITLYKEDLNDISYSEVISACIQTGWLHEAHDILDDLESDGVPLAIGTYMSLLTAYEKENKSEEFNGLLRQIQKAVLSMTDIRLNSSCTLKDIAKVAKDEAPLTKSTLFEILVKELQQDDCADHLIHELNSSILFFCKAKMMEDALTSYRRMRERNVRPTLQTFCHILVGYSSLGMYRETTILWGEIKRELEHGDLTVDRDLLDCLVLNFLKGGYFARVMEVISYMSKHNIYCDKWKYRKVFLKLHKNLYRNLNTLHNKTEAQSKRIEDVRAFRSWAGIR